VAWRGQVLADTAPPCKGMLPPMLGGSRAPACGLGLWDGMYEGDGASGGEGECPTETAGSAIGGEEEGGSRHGGDQGGDLSGGGLPHDYHPASPLTTDSDSLGPGLGQTVSTQAMADLLCPYSLHSAKRPPPRGHPLFYL